MCRRQLFFSSIMLAGLAQPSAAQAPPERYAIPCRAQQAFAARVRGLVRDTNGVERALAQFSIVAEADTPSADARWTLRVSRLDRAASDPRSVREASCERAADAAALVVSAWMDEDPVAAASGEVDSRGLPADRPELGVLPLIGQGVSVLAEAASALGPGGFRPGMSVELWNRGTGEITYQALGFSLWPSAVAEQASPRNDRYARPFAEFSLHQGGYLLGRNSFRAGLLFSAHFGVKQLEPRHYAPTLRLSLAAMVECDIGIWSIFYRIGFSGMADATVKATLVSSLGVGAMLF